MFLQLWPWRLYVLIYCGHPTEWTLPSLPSPSNLVWMLRLTVSHTHIPTEQEGFVVYKTRLSEESRAGSQAGLKMAWESRKWRLARVWLLLGGGRVRGTCMQAGCHSAVQIADALLDLVPRYLCQSISQISKTPNNLSFVLCIFIGQSFTDQ